MSSLSQSSGEKPIVEVKSESQTNFFHVVITVAVVVVEVRNLPLLKFTRRPDVSVEIVAENVRHRTEVVRKNTSPHWDAEFTLCVPICAVTMTNLSNSVALL
jgi:hypothetical protein